MCHNIKVVKVDREGHHCVIAGIAKATGDDALPVTSHADLSLEVAVGVKTGLDVSPLSRTPDQGWQALDALHAGTGGNATKKLWDHLLCRALELCMEFGVPMQIHTGMGDYDVNFVQCRPSLLMDLLRFPVFCGCRVLLVHTGYPYHAEAGYMAGVLAGNARQLYGLE